MHLNGTTTSSLGRRRQQRNGNKLFAVGKSRASRKTELRETLRREFQEKEKRQIRAAKALNTWIASQIKVLREQRKLTQKQLATLAGMTQPRIATLEDIDYSSWSINTLRRLAEAFDLRLSVKFESFSSLVSELENFSAGGLQRPSFSEDAWFHEGEANQPPPAGPVSEPDGMEARNPKSTPGSITESMYQAPERARSSVTAAMDAQ